MDPQLDSLLGQAIRHSERINTKKEQKYWYPLAMATYGVEEIKEALDSMCSFRTTMWEKTEQFERMFAKRIGVRHAVMVNSGSSADLILMFALADEFGDSDLGEALIPAVTWPTQIWSAMMAGFKPVLVDVNPRDLRIDHEDFLRKLGPKTSVVFLTNILGAPCDVSELERAVRDSEAKQVAIVQDCCEALGTRYGGKEIGALTLASTFSFFFSHHITTMEGGMIAADESDLASRLRILRAHGWTRNIPVNSDRLAGFKDVDPRYAFVNWGFNVRPTELQAAFGIHQLGKLDGFEYKRRLYSRMFFEFVDGQKWIYRPKSSCGDPCWLALPVMVSEDAPFTKMDLTSWLEENGIETRPIVVGDITRQPVSLLFSELRGLDLPGARTIHDYGFYIGLSPMFSEEMVKDVIGYFKTFLDARG